MSKTRTRTPRPRPMAPLPTLDSLDGVLRSEAARLRTKQAAKAEPKPLAEVIGMDAALEALARKYQKPCRRNGVR